MTIACFFHPRRVVKKSEAISRAFIPCLNQSFTSFTKLSMSRSALTMQCLALLATFLAVASAAPSADTVQVCDYLFKKYPNFVAYDTLGSSALKTIGNASVYSVSLAEHFPLDRTNSINRRSTECMHISPQTNHIHN
jgi:hypothetical protein